MLDELPSVLNPEITGLLQLLSERIWLFKGSDSCEGHMANPFPLSIALLGYSLAELQRESTLFFIPFNWSSCGSHLQLQRFPSQPAVITSIT